MKCNYLCKTDKVEAGLLHSCNVISAFQAAQAALKELKRDPAQCLRRQLFFGPAHMHTLISSFSPAS